jgi:hypothetical protein
MSDPCVTLVSKKLIPIANGTPFFRNFASLDLEHYEPDSDFMDKLIWFTRLACLPAGRLGPSFPPTKIV